MSSGRGADGWVALREALAAEGLTPGPWQHIPDEEWGDHVRAEGRLYPDGSPDDIAAELDPVTARYIAAADPTTVADLLAGLDAKDRALGDAARLAKELRVALRSGDLPTVMDLALMITGVAIDAKGVTP